MNNFRVYVYAICRNEEKFVDAWMDSMSEADGVYVMDTGSGDGTVEKLRARGAHVVVREVKPWRFDTARNLSMELLPEDADICVCTDLDERLEPGWRALLESRWPPGTQRAFYTYNWRLKPDGSPYTQLTYFKIHTRRDFEWRLPIHEYLEYTGPGKESSIYIEELVLNHYPDLEKPRGSYLPMLETAISDEPDNERIVYYLGREYLYIGQWQKCIDTLTRQLNMPSSTWREERCACMRWIALACLKLDNRTESYAWYHKAIAECPELRDTYVEFAQAAYDYKDWDAVYYYAETALKITQKNIKFVNMGYAWDHTADDMAAIACWELGLYERALEHAKKAAELSPDIERLMENVRRIQDVKNRIKESL
ncbi:MAG: glycosyl transferase family 2 [Clostridiales bacterium]|nr:glycosyl transferase family 2 [Clostridiales bacterium]